MSAALEHRLPGDPARLQALHGRMVEALLDGGGLHAIARLAAQAAGGRVVVDLPREGLAASTPGAGDGVALRVPITTGGEVVGTVALHREGGAPPAAATEALHAAAMATLTYLALLREDEPRRDAGARLVEAVLDGLPNAAGKLRAAGVEVAGALSVRLPAGRTGRVSAAVADHAPDAPRTVRDGWLHALPAAGTDAARLATTLHERLGIAAAGVALRPGADPATALRETQLAAQLVAEGVAPPAELARGTWRLLVRDALRTPEDVADLAADALGPMLDDAGGAAAEQLRTFEAYVANNCNMNATAAALPAHRHTIAYRLDRVRELTGLDPLVAEHREQLGVALKARAVIRARAAADRGAGI
jgi:hypothetical protein